MRSFASIILVLSLGAVAVSGQFRFAGNNQGGTFFNRGPQRPAFAQTSFQQQGPFQQQGFQQQGFQQQAFQQQAFRQPASAAAAVVGGGGCTPTPNYQSGGKNFWVSWRSCGTQYQATEVPAACASGGMRPVTLSDPALAQEFMNLAAQEGQKWFWTGGRISGQTITWPNGQSQNVDQLRSLFSHTGG